MRPVLTSSAPAVHGGAARLPVDLSASLNPLGPSPLALAAAHASLLHRYPEVDAASLTAAAADRHRIDAACVVPVPGASWGLWFCLLAYGAHGRRCSALAPCFAEYRRAAEIAGLAYQETGELAAVFVEQPDVVLVGNPANPTGRALPAEDLRAACGEHRRTLFIVDEAFAAFAPAGTSLVAGNRPPRNAIVVRSLTKELALPGLRMGYLVAVPDLARELRHMLPPWPLSAPSIAAGTAGCRDAQHVERGAQVARRHVQLMSDALRLQGVPVLPSSANFVCCAAPELLAKLAAHGIAARDCASFGLPGHVRLAAPTPTELPAVLEALRA